MSQFEILGQTDSLWSASPEIEITGFTDIYYAYDFNTPETTFRQPFLFNHNRHNEFNLNLGMIKIAAVHAKYRSNFALHTGTYVQDNYSAEPGVLKNIFEANVGLSLIPSGKLWLDAGILPSHIGFESAVSLDNSTLTRSLLAENSPYFMTGAKLTYTPRPDWELAAIVNNGWQRIQRVSGNSLPGFGTQIVYKPSTNATFNWSTFAGTDDPDSTRRMRYFSNVYGIIQVSEKLEIIGGFDVGFQESAITTDSYDNWLSPVLIARYRFKENFAAAIRLEHYQDPGGVIVGFPEGVMLKTNGYSLNLDYNPTPDIACRLEGRWLSASDNSFPRESTSVSDNFTLVGSIAVRFSHLIKPDKATVQ